MKRKIPVSLKDLVKMVVETAVPVVIGLVAEKITAHLERSAGGRSRRKKGRKKKAEKAKRRRRSQTAKPGVGPMGDALGERALVE